MPDKRASMKEFVAQLKPAEEKCALAVRNCAQHIQAAPQRKLRGTDETLIPPRKSVDMVAIASYPIGVGLATEPAFDLCDAPRAQQTSRIGRLRDQIGSVGILPLCVGDQTLGLEKPQQSE